MWEREKRQVSGRPAWRLTVPTRDGEDPVQATTEETERVETTFTRRRWQNSLTVGCVVRVS